jgi:hypothetical protein
MELLAVVAPLAVNGRLVGLMSIGHRSLPFMTT